MIKLLPKSLLGQVLVSAMLALLVAQIVSAALLFRASEEWRETSALNALAFQLVAGAQSPDRFRASPEGRGPRVRRVRDAAQEGPATGAPGPRLPRSLRYNISQAAPQIGTDENASAAAAKRLSDILSIEGVAPVEIILVSRRAGDDPQLRAFADGRPRFAARKGWRERTLYVAAIRRAEGADWEVARVLERSRPRGALGLLLFQTLVTFGVLCILLFLILRRITRPLADLTERVGSFSKTPDRAVRLEETGPADIRHLIAAHNAMESRISALLDEKDVMLGAIGHDLKTPLAALRVRIESVPDDRQRAALATTIEDITRTLDDILSLARMGRARRDTKGSEAVNISALADNVVEEFEDLGQPVTLEIPQGRTQRLVARVEETWLKRGLRNLISNAVRYGGGARVKVHASEDGKTLILQVDDDGPGIPDDRIEDMLEPFKRGEASRNRTTGGAGLGLTLARAIAQAHSGQLVLANRPEGGLRAEIILPL